MLKPCVTSIISSCFLLFSAVAQPQLQWQKCIGGSRDDIANSVTKLIDGSFIIVGSSLSNDGQVSGHHGSMDSTDAWIVKLSPAGELLWQKSVGGTGNDAFINVNATGDGGMICIGETNSINNGDVKGFHDNDGSTPGYHGAPDIWVVKFSKDGEIEWSKCLAELDPTTLAI